MTNRPQISAAQAALFSRERVLSLTGRAGSETLDPWEPELRPLRNPLIVGRGGYDTIQAAIDHAISNGQTQIDVDVQSPEAKGLVYIPKGFEVAMTGPATVMANIDAEMSGAEYRARFGAQFEHSPPPVRSMFERIAQRDKITTANASALRIEGDGFQAQNLTIQNTYDCTRPGTDADATRNEAGQFVTGQHQAVAVLVAGADRCHFDNVRMGSFQDTLYLQHPADFETSRSYFHGCDIEGDVDFIFGQATGYFEGCTLRSLGTRARQSWFTAPATNIRTTYGLVFNACRFECYDPDNRGRHSLGRQWFEGVRATPYGTPTIDGYRCVADDQSWFDGTSGGLSRKSLESVGKCVILASEIDPKIQGWEPWNGGAWAPRYRPVLANAGAFIQQTAGWADFRPEAYDDIAPDMVFLGEYQTRP